jgi:hypothetical protein
MAHWAQNPVGLFCESKAPAAWRGSPRSAAPRFDFLVAFFEIAFGPFSFTVPNVLNGSLASRMLNFAAASPRWPQFAVEIVPSGLMQKNANG